MSTQLQLRKGNTAQTAVFTGALAEVTVDTDQKTVVVHDGTTVGGTYIITRAQLDSNVSILQGINTSQNTRISIIEGVNLGQNTTITAVNNFAQSSYDTANATNNFAVSAFGKANSANVLAQSAFDSSNAVNGYATSAFATANGANGLAAGAFNTANGANGLANGAYAAANAAYSYTTQVQAIADAAYLKANAAFDSSNAVNGYAVSAFATANGANGLAQSAFNTANTNAGNITIIQGVDATQNTNITAVNTFAGSAFDTANGANGLAQSAFNTANTNASNITIIQGVDLTQNTRLSDIETINTNQNNAITIIQGVDLTQNTTITAVNNYAAAAFNKANTGGTFTGNVIIQQNLTVDKDLIVTGNLIIGGNTTSISANNLVIDDPIIVLANNNTLDVVDIGFIGHYDEFAPDEYRHTGVIRHAETNEYYIFYNYDKHVHANTGANNIINILDPSFLLSNVNGGYFKGNLIATTAVIGGTDFANYISVTQGVDNTQNTRLNAIETINTDQNTAIGIIQGVDNTQNTTITAVNNFAASAFNAANTNASNITVIQGVDATQNTRLNAIETINTDQNTAIGIIQGVDLTQNTNITAVNNFAAEAFTRANNSVLKSGDTMSGSLTGVTTLGVTTIQFAQTDATTNTFTTASTAQVSVDAWPTASYRSAKYFVQVTSGSSYHIIELNLVHNGTTVFLAQYGEVITNASLGTFDADISGDTTRLLFTGTNAVSTVRVLRTVMDA
jgi:ethanolamine utilization protein EutP (predicted NTPase)